MFSNDIVAFFTVTETIFAVPLNLMVADTPQSPTCRLSSSSAGYPMTCKIALHTVCFVLILFLKLCA